MHQVVFTGRLLKGADRAKVESELQRLFKATPRQVDWFLRGKAIVVKSTEDLALADRYQQALTKAGLECELRSDQPATEPMAAPPEASPPPQRQLPIPGVPPPVAPKRKTRPVQPAVARRPPTLGRVTQAITAQDRAPAFQASPAPVASAKLVETAPVLSSSLRRGLRLAFLLLGAIFVGVVAYGVRQQWPAQQAGDLPVVSGSAVTGAKAPAVTGKPAATGADAPAQQLPAREALIVGRWHCVEAASGRMVENEFSSDGRYRSLTYGKADAFQQIEQLDVLVEGRYRLEGNQIVLHVQHIPSREYFGGSARADEYLYWRIDTLTTDTMVWTDLQLQEVRESCLRSQSMAPETG